MTLPSARCLGEPEVGTRRSGNGGSHGCAALAEAIGDPDGCAAVGVEGTQPCGAGLVDEPRRRGFRVPGVPGPKREDKRRRGEGKDDGTGAERAARDVIAGKAASVPKRTRPLPCA